MKKIPCVFLCGDRSPYGMAHLEAVAKNFDLKAIVIADNQRRNHFRNTLSGGEIYEFKKLTAKLQLLSKKLIRKPLDLFRENKHQHRLRLFDAHVVEMYDVNSQKAINLINGFSPEVLLSAAYPQFFSQTLMCIAPRGAVNFHPSLLPRCRGAHPHYWSLATGEQYGGITAHYMTKRLDAGAIIAQRKFELTGMYYEDLYKKIIEETPYLVRDVVEFLKNPHARTIPQDESLATVFRNEREIHRRLDFHGMNSQDLFNKIRAGRAYAHHRGKRINIGRAEVLNNNRHMINDFYVPPGVIVDLCGEGVVVSTKDGKFLVLQKVSVGGKVLDFYDWVASLDVKIGERLE